MRKILYAGMLIMICNISYADIASTGYVDSAVATKQDTISDIETIRSGAGLGATAVQPSSLSTVAKTGSYNDLSNKPTIPNIPTGPSDGKKYNLVWNGETGQFMFKEMPREPLQCYDIGFDQCIDPKPDAIDYGYMDDSTGEYGADSYNTAAYGLVMDQTWGATLYTGDKVTGIASCNSTPGTYAQSTNQNFNQTDKGEYCWCKMTEPAVSRWVFLTDRSHADYCAYDCAGYCADSVRLYSDFRSGVFSSVGQ
ncbi:MAG: hypothetical protein KBS86_03320 [Proteobacteria bacterium]|nr:hypothetical protein [Candidatus Enterousia scatequi]